MNAKYRQALPRLKENVKFDVEEITSLDLFYNDGDSRVRNSFFKLVFPNAVVYIQEGGWWLSYGSLTETQSNSLREWIQNL